MRYIPNRLQWRATQQCTFPNKNTEDLLEFILTRCPLAQIFNKFVDEDEKKK